MSATSLNRSRKWFALGLLGVAAVAGAWHFSSGMPILFGPRASAADKEAGYELFVRDWAVADAEAHGDGLGPVFNDTSCVACHFQGGAGGGGPLTKNVTNYEVFPTSRDPELHSGTIHVSATSKDLRETFDMVRQRYPIIKGGQRTVDHCTINVPDVDPLRTETIQTTALFGAGWIDRISEKAITAARRRQLFDGLVKESKLDFESISPGRPRVLADGRIGKFGWKAQFATLDEFVAAACANEVGLGTPGLKQVKPFNRPDYPDSEPDLDRKQFKQLVAFVDTLPKPVEVVPGDSAERDKAVRGKQLFGAIGCAVCHVPDLGGVKGVYTDLLLHSLDDPRPTGGSSTYGPRPPDTPPIPDEIPNPEEWKTPALWGVADSAPYMHDGHALTLETAIQRHGGDARPVREVFNKLQSDEQQAVVAFLKTLKAPPDARPAPAVAKR